MHNSGVARARLTHSSPQPQKKTMRVWRRFERERSDERSADSRPTHVV